MVHYLIFGENIIRYMAWTRDSLYDYVNRMSFPKLEVYDIDVTDTLALNIKMITNRIHLVIKRYPSS